MRRALSSGAIVLLLTILQQPHCSLLTPLSDPLSLSLGHRLLRPHPRTLAFAGSSPVQEALCARGTKSPGTCARCSDKVWGLGKGPLLRCGRRLSVDRLIAVSSCAVNVKTLWWAQNGGLSFAQRGNMVDNATLLTALYSIAFNY